MTDKHTENDENAIKDTGDTFGNIFNPSPSPIREKGKRFMGAKFFVLQRTIRKCTRADRAIVATRKQYTQGPIPTCDEITRAAE